MQNIKLVKVIILLSALILTAGAVNAQNWQSVKHNGYLCCLLKSTENQTVLVGKTTDAGGNELLNVKFKIPYRWGNTGTAHAKLTQIDLISGKRYTQDGIFHHNNGWVYISHYLVCGATRACYNYIITVYKNNDNGQSGGASARFNLHLDALDISRLPFSEKHYETYW
ncbi:MAG: hypothetical protein LBL90_07990 [Prevotellaceae bacterium]|nr:hypothetical protein [Prevotellaceae bacterium]